jgi:hypothetical protein
MQHRHRRGHHHFHLASGARVHNKTGYHRMMANFPDVLRTVTALEIFRVWAPSFE